jgi:hypothetical protein
MKSNFPILHSIRVKMVKGEREPRFTFKMTTKD